ncbi:MAG TPA: hypothetical protein PKA10_15545 [Selenomonadales bacterium]|nr:hypothetical protein [Selenomonadales bacterium]
MKNKITGATVSLLLILLIAAGCSGKTVPAPAPSPERLDSDLALPAGYVVLDRQTGDVTGDGKSKDIFLVGRKPDMNSKFADDLRIMVQAGEGQNAVTMELPAVGGYDGKLFVGDFSGDKISDVLVTVPTGGSGGIVEHRIVTFAGGPAIIWGEGENSGIAAAGRFVDGFKGELTEETTKRKAIVDLAAKKDAYIQAGLYNAGGTLLRQQSLSVNPLGELRPLALSPDGKYGLKGQQRVTGVANADTVAYIYSLWEYENQKWTAKQIEVASVLLSYGEGQR